MQRNDTTRNFLACHQQRSNLYKLVLPSHVHIRWLRLVPQTRSLVDFQHIKPRRETPHHQPYFSFGTPCWQPQCLQQLRYCAS